VTGEDRAWRRESIYVDGFGHVNPVPAASRIGPFVASGVITGRDPQTRELPSDLESQCAHMFAHLREIVTAAGGDIGDVLKVTVWLRDPSDRVALNHAWESMFPDPDDRPARHVQQGTFAEPMLVQCDFLAVLRGPC